MPKVNTLPGMIPTVTFDQYRDKYKEHFTLERSESGVLMAKMHTKGGPLIWNQRIHRAIHQLTTDVGQDVETEVFILSGTGDYWMAGIDAPHEETIEHKQWVGYEHMYYDGCRDEEGIVFSLEIPTIGVINGPGFHTEMALFCDITIMADDAAIIDPHYSHGMVPGDGVQLAYRYCVGSKRAMYAMLTGEKIDAKKALEYGFVNEVVPKKRIFERAWELGEQLAKSNRILRRLTVQVLRQPLREEMTKELRAAFGLEMFNYLSTTASHPTEDLATMKAKIEAAAKKK